MKDFYKNKVVLITGSSMGIGKEIALQALNLGAQVVINGRDLERLENMKNELSTFHENLLFLPGDVSDYSRNVAMVNTIIDIFGRLDVLITNAGLSCYGELEEMTSDTAKQTIDCNIYGSLFPARAALSELKKTKGNILFISSIAGFHGLPECSAYSLSKMAIKALAQSLSVEVYKSGMTIGIAYVGFTENDPDKKTLSPIGQLVPVPDRASFSRVSKTTSALKLLKQIKSGKFSNTHSLLGMLSERMSRYFPSLMLYIIKEKYKRIRIMRN